MSALVIVSEGPRALTCSHSPALVRLSSGLGFLGLLDGQATDDFALVLCRGNGGISTSFMRRTLCGVDSALLRVDRRSCEGTFITCVDSRPGFATC